eukprot:3467976-Ditylum_brightwellii.AAC.2
MIKGTSNEETVQAKDRYERFMLAYGHRVEAYHGDNSRFGSKKSRPLANWLKNLHLLQKSGQESLPLPFGLLCANLRRNATIIWT